MNTYRVYNPTGNMMEYLEIKANNQKEAEQIFIKTAGIYQTDFLEFVYGGINETSLINRMIGSRAENKWYKRAANLQELVLASYIQEQVDEYQQDKGGLYVIDMDGLKEHENIVTKCIGKALSTQYDVQEYNEAELIYIYQVFWKNQMKEAWKIS